MQTRVREFVHEVTDKYAVTKKFQLSTSRNGLSDLLLSCPQTL